MESKPNICFSSLVNNTEGKYNCSVITNRLLILGKPESNLVAFFFLIITVKEKHVQRKCPTKQKKLVKSPRRVIFQVTRNRVFVTETKRERKQSQVAL